MRDRLLVIMLAASLLAAGIACNAVDRLFTPDDSVDSESTETLVPEAQPSATVPNPTSTPTAAPLSGAECLIGSWNVDTDSYQAFLSSTFGDADQGVVDSIEGSMRVTFSEDGTATTETDLVMTFCASGECITFEVQQSGSSAFTASGGALSLSGGEAFTAVFSTPFGELSGSSEMEGEEVGFACQADTLTVAVEGFPELIWNRVP